MKRFWTTKFWTNKYWLVSGVLVLALVLVGGTLLIEHVREDSRPAGVGPQTTGAGGTVAETAGLPDSASPAVAPQSEAVELGQVKNPPQHTLAYVNADDFSADSYYVVTFVPYGIGVNPRTLIIEIVSSHPRGDVARPFDFTGHNAVVDTSGLPADMAIEEGGTYTGTLELVRQQSGLATGGVLAPMLVEASAAR